MKILAKVDCYKCYKFLLCKPVNLGSENDGRHTECAYYHVGFRKLYPTYGETPQIGPIECLSPLKVIALDGFRHSLC